MVQCLPRPAQRSASQTSLITQLYIRMMRATSPELSEMGLLSVVSRFFEFLIRHTAAMTMTSSPIPRIVDRPFTFYTS